MFRVAATTLAKSGLSRSSTGSRLAAPSTCTFHHSAPRMEEKKEEAAVESTDSGISPLYAIPIGVAAAVPILQFQWYIPNEETLLASTFLGFCVVAYTQGGQLIANSFKEESNALLKAQNEAEDQVIAKLEETVEYMKLTENIVTDYKEVYDLTEASYAKLNQAGKIKPQHDLKAQVEKILNVMAVEEQSSYEKAKIALMAEATESVMKEFLTNEQLKKAALSAAVGKLTGKAKAAGADPVQTAFVNFFKEKSKAAKASDDGSEEKAARAAMLTKMNAIASAENMYFRFDETTGKPVMTV
ncbi:mitochondrial ATP synthase B chain precursor [Nitzschia inconspicua]|uniref:ATP synthase subunit b n=1 Tax=Nitzschia inconspicua TaxID=303405 RepID=A0A9K3M4N4_9STRA|nr:mitochondrial ATP synthase B chain precursor [Nitzschia inconspicua]